jgi:hypothetical protein
MQLQTAPSGSPDWLYFAIVAALGMYFIIGGIAWTMFIHKGGGAGFIHYLLAAIAGGLVRARRALAALADPRRIGRTGRRHHPGNRRRHRVEFRRQPAIAPVIEHRRVVETSAANGYA